MTRKTRAKYNPEFKREAVRLLEQGDKETAQLARELSVARNKLYQYKNEIDRHGTSAFPGTESCNGRAKINDATLLKAENKWLREESEILKKVAIFFARELD